MGLKEIFIDGDRWQFIWHGLEITLLITIFATILGVVMGLILALMRQSEWAPFCKGRGQSGWKNWRPISSIAKLYVTVIRGTPALVQLLIFYYVIFGSAPDVSKLWVATLAFGFNSAAYVAEIVRGGINSIDKGQVEAARSLGFSYGKTMRFVVMPQALRNSLPALINEFITLLKETAIVGWIGMNDLMRGADNIRFQTGTAFESLFAVALIYLTVTSIFTKLMNRVEKKINAER